MHPLNWIFAENPSFKQTDVLQLVPGLSAATMQNWANRGVSEPVTKHPSRGKRRVYDGDRLLVFKVAQGLIYLELPASPALAIALEIVAAFAREVKERSKRPGRATWGEMARLRALLVPQSDRSFGVTIFDYDTPPFEAMFTGNLPVIIVPVGEWMTGTAVDAYALLAARGKV